MCHLTKSHKYKLSSCLSHLASYGLDFALISSNLSLYFMNYNLYKQGHRKTPEHANSQANQKYAVHAAHIT